MLTERCYFINFPFYHRSFAPELDFSWQAHVARLAAFGHDVNAQPPHKLQFWKGQDLNAWYALHVAVLVLALCGSMQNLHKAWVQRAAIEIRMCFGSCEALHAMQGTAYTVT